MSAFEMFTSMQAPAASYACLMGMTGCVSCRPAPSPCREWAGLRADVWCPCCGWAWFAHADVKAEAVTP